jgi:hypothetical protein
MNMFRHDNEAVHAKSILNTSVLQRCYRQVSSLAGSELCQAVVATESDEMGLPGVVKTSER